MAEILNICRHDDGYGKCELSGGYCVEGPCENEELVEYAPVVHGEWEDHLVSMSCSVCRDHFFVYDNETHRFNFCPNCGAKMDGGEGGHE